MRKRCSNPNHWAYRRYGGRGIAVDSAWNEFGAFEAWAKNHGYSEHLTIDRKNNDGPYSPENCRWISQKEQCRNKSNNIRFEYDGKTLTLGEWADIVNISFSTLYSRIHNYGWSVERALTTPPRK